MKELIVRNWTICKRKGMKAIKRRDMEYRADICNSDQDLCITCAAVGPCRYPRQMPFCLQCRRRAPGMGPESETAVSKLSAAATEAGWQTPAVSRSNHHAATAIPLCVCALPCCGPLDCKIMRQDARLNSSSRFQVPRMIGEQKRSKRLATAAQ